LDEYAVDPIQPHFQLLHGLFARKRTSISLNAKAWSIPRFEAFDQKDDEGYYKDPGVEVAFSDVPDIPDS
jgi:hypothetical protein